MTDRKQCRNVAIGHAGANPLHSGALPRCEASFVGIGPARSPRFDQDRTGGAIVDNRQHGQARAGEKRLREIVLEGGFGSFHRVAETPFDLVFEVSP